MASASWGLVIAGSYYSNSNSEILVDPRKGWKLGPNLEIGVGSTVALSAFDKIYLAGGYQNYGMKNVFELAGPDQQWRAIGKLNRVRYYHAAW